jgi:hypothetical protein
VSPIGRKANGAYALCLFLSMRFIFCLGGQLMKMQSKWYSFLEAIANTLSGYFLAVFAAQYIFLWLGIHTTLADNFKSVALFTILSFVRSYVWRRFFVRLGDIKGMFRQAGVFFLPRKITVDSNGDVVIPPYSIKDTGGDK